MSTKSFSRKPVLFVSHGSPMLLNDEDAGHDYRRWGKALGTPKAILVFSAHWETDGLFFGETGTHNKLIYDFYGFPQDLYEVQYAAPGAPWLTEAIENCLDLPIAIQDRGLDHGVYVPLTHMWPEANVPILQMSLPKNFSNTDLYRLGERLLPLREQGVVIIGAGALTHNLRAFDPNNKGEPAAWAKDFDDWIAHTLVERDIDALFNWEDRAPNAKMNHPTSEHFRPLLVSAGAGYTDTISFPITGFDFSVFTRRSVQFGETNK